jgi:site-specific DNA recombinase
MIEITEVKYCLYACKSSEQDEHQAMSIDSQLKEMLALAERDGLNITMIKKESHSAKQSSQRPVFNELLQDIISGKVDGILTWAPDRLSRNAGGLGSLVDLMDGNKLQQIRTFSQSFSNTPNEKFLLMILCSQAKLENDDRGINIKSGIRARCEMSVRPCRTPFGYANFSLDGQRKIVLDLERSAAIAEVFQRTAEGQSGRQIKRWLDASGFRTRSDKCVSLSQLYIILKNPFYYGEFKFGSST